MSNYGNEYTLLARTLHQQKVNLVGMFSVLGGGFNYKLVKDLPDVAETMAAPLWKGTLPFKS